VLCCAPRVLLLRCAQIGFTPLHLAIEHKHDGMVALLLKLGAGPDIPNKVRQQQQQQEQQQAEARCSS
jgi:ankyrin repeat protein